MSRQHDQGTITEAMNFVLDVRTSAGRISAATGNGSGLSRACSDCAANIGQIGSSPKNSPTPGM